MEQFHRIAVCVYAFLGKKTRQFEDQKSCELLARNEKFLSVLGKTDTAVLLQLHVN